MAQAPREARAKSEIFRTLATVIRTADLTPRMRRITLGGEGVRPLIGNCLPADAIKLYIPEVGKPGFLPKMLMFPTWNNRFHTRAYTVRRFDTVALELDIDIFLHGDTVGSVWARTVQVGEQIGFVGPRQGNLGTTKADWYLLAGDESALPAIAALVEGLDASIPAYLFIEVQDQEDEIPFTSKAMVTVQWIHRGSLPAANSTLLEEHLRQFTWQTGVGYVWVAGHSGVVRAIRHYIEREKGVPKEYLHTAGYWK